MLTINQNKNLSLFKQNRFLNRRFLFALSLAIALHLFALIFFKIESFRIGDSLTLLPPMVIESVLIDNESSVKTEVDSRDRRYAFQPRKPELTLPEAPKINWHKSQQIVHPQVQKNPFLIPLPSTTSYSAPSQTIFSHQIAILGPLNTRPFTTSKKEQLVLVSNKMKQARALYDVRVENQSGKIFWFEQLEASGPLTSEMEDFLSSLHFSPMVDGISRGKVEIILSWEES